MKKVLMMLMVFLCVGCGISHDEGKSTNTSKTKNGNVAVIKNEKISEASYAKLEFNSSYDDEQITVEVKNVSDEIVKVSKLMVIVYDKSGKKNEYEIPLEITLEKGEITNTTFSYRIEDIKKIEFSYK